MFMMLCVDDTNSLDSKILCIHREQDIIILKLFIILTYYILIRPNFSKLPETKHCSF